MGFDIGFVIALVLAMLVIFWLFFKLHKEKDKYNNEIIKQRDKYSKLLHQKKSSEVRLGKIGENLAPFVEGWPYDPNGFRFLGNPVDGIQFNNDEIIFIEIKTGKSRLSKSQRKFKEIVLKGNVKFATFRINEKGTNLDLVEGKDEDDL